MLLEVIGFPRGVLLGSLMGIHSPSSSSSFFFILTMMEPFYFTTWEGRRELGVFPFSEACICIPYFFFFYILVHNFLLPFSFSCSMLHITPRQCQCQCIPHQSTCARYTCKHPFLTKKGKGKKVHPSSTYENEADGWLRRGGLGCHWFVYSFIRLYSYSRDYFPTRPSFL